MKKKRVQLIAKKSKPPEDKLDKLNALDQLSKVIVNCQNRQQLIDMNKQWQQMKAIISQKFQISYKDSLQYLYEFQDELIQIMIQKDYQIFCQIVTQNKQTSLMVRIYQNSSKNENDIKKIKIKINQQIQNQKMKDKKQRQDIIWLKCKLCKERKRQKKYICILCQKTEQVYCYDCHEKRQNPKQHILKEMQMGDQRQIAFLRDCLEKQQKTLNESQLNFLESTEKHQFFLKEDFKKLMQNYQVDMDQDQKKIIPNLMSLTKRNPQVILKHTCNINSIIKMKDLQSAKMDFLEFLQKKQKLNSLQSKDIKFELQQQNSMLKLYSNYSYVYRNTNLSLKESQIGSYPERLAYTRYPINLLYHQTQEHYKNQIRNGNKKYLKQFKVFRGGVIQKKQYENLQKDQEIQILSFMSTSFKLQVANNDFFKQNLLLTIIKPQNKGFEAHQGFCILNQHGQSQNHHHEEEVLFNVYSKFRVLKKFYNDQLNLYEITLEYLEIPENINNENVEKISLAFNIPTN